jgi:signal transduction histidine kinase/ligand-binding sensor domain-containing protein
VLGSNREEAKYFNLNNADKYSLSANFIRSSVAIPGRGVLVGTLKKGAFILDNNQISEKSFTFRSIPAPADQNDSQHTLAVFDATLYEGGNVILGTSDGLFSYDIGGDSLRKFSGGISYTDKQEIVSVLQPANGIVLASFYDEGLFEFRSDNPGLLTEIRNAGDMKPAGSIREFAEYDGRMLAVGREGVFEIAGGNLSASELGRFTEGRNVLTAAMADDEQVWLGMNDGIMIIDEQSGSPKFLRLPDGSSVNELAFDGQDKMYAGTSAGIRVIDAATGLISKVYRHDPDDPGSLSEDMILSLYIDSGGNLWAGTYAGLSLLRKGSGKFERFRKVTGDPASLINNYVYSILEYSGKIYLGTAGGLSIFDGSVFRNFTSANGLTDQAISSLALYEGKIVIGSNFNIQIFDPEQNTFSLAGKFDDILNPSACARSTDGTYYFGGRNGVIALNITGLMRPVHDNKFMFTRITYEQGGKKHTADLTSLTELRLDHDAVNIDISFSDLNYSGNGLSSYYYNVSGIDDGWTYAGGSSMLGLKTLPPGTHEILVKVAESGGSSYESPFALKIMVSPPFYRTLPFFLVCAALLTAIAYGAHSFNANRKVRRALEIEHAREEEREKIRYEASRDYHDELGHKLTRISIYSRNLLREIEAQKASISKELHKIMETSASLKESARDLIWSMDPGEDTLYDLALRIKDFAESLLQEKGISLQASGISESMKTVYLGMDVKRNLLLIAKEAVNNSVKYSEASQMKIGFESHHDPFIMKLSDDGVGFDDAALSEGFGIRSMKARAARIGAAILISGRSGNGTSVEVSLDLRKGIKEFSLN